MSCGSVYGDEIFLRRNKKVIRKFRRNRSFLGILSHLIKSAAFLLVAIYPSGNNKVRKKQFPTVIVSSTSRRLKQPETRNSCLRFSFMKKKEIHNHDAFSEIIEREEKRKERFLSISESSSQIIYILMLQILFL